MWQRLDEAGQEQTRMVTVPAFDGGRIRLGLFIPQFSKTPTGDINPTGAGLVARDMLTALAKRLGLELEIVEHPTPPSAITSLNEGGCDVLITGIEPSRIALVDFTPPVIQFDYAYLVPAGSAIKETAEVDQPGHRISVVEGHASWMALKRVIKSAEIVGRHMPDEAFALIRNGDVDVFALPREQLLDYAAELPGSRVLKDGFGINDVALAVAKGRTDMLAFMTAFVDEAKASGLIQRILDSADLCARGFNVGPPRSVHMQ
jgi:polar amino acid transport system substrate-binding protein